jgi:hypothetical protein
VHGQSNSSAQAGTNPTNAGSATGNSGPTVSGGPSHTATSSSSPNGQSANRRSQDRESEREVEMTVRLFDPKDYDAADLDRPNNPHFDIVDDPSESNVELPRSALHFTWAPFPRVILSVVTLLDGITDKQRRELLAEADDVVAIVPWNSGHRFLKNNNSYWQDVQAALLTFGIEGCDDMLFVNPDLASLTGKPLDPPYALFLRNIPQELRDFLVSHQTFSFSDKLTFNVFSLNRYRMSWVLANLDGSVVPVTDSEKRKREVLAVVKETLWASGPLHQLCIRIIARMGISATPPAFKAHLLNSFELSYVAMNDLEGRPKSIYQLTGRPISTSHADQRDYIECIKKHKYQLNGATINTGREMSCSQCKSDRHPSHLCPFPKFDDWNGKKKDLDTERPSQNVPTHNGGTRGRGGKRGSGSAPRGSRQAASRGKTNRFSNLRVYDAE